MHGQQNIKTTDHYCVHKIVLPTRILMAATNLILSNFFFLSEKNITPSSAEVKNHHHHHKYQGLGPLIRSDSKVTTALSNVSSVFQLFSFLVVCSSMI